MNSSLARFPVGAFSLGFFMRLTNVRKLWCLAQRQQSTVYCSFSHPRGWMGNYAKGRLVCFTKLAPAK